MIVNTGKWSEAQLDDIMRQASLISHTSEKIEFISSQFLGTSYRQSTLTGTAVTAEVLVIDLEGVDCFTLLDYVEAMRISASLDGLKNNVARVRYRHGKVSFRDRNHFFTDWREYSADRITDVTGAIGGGKARKVVKMLNLKEDGSYFLPGIEVRRREICFIPSDDLDDNVMGGLQSGDYIGIYSRSEGLDVSHAGILIKTGGSVYLRHASSAGGVGKVVDEDLMRYISSRPGLVVLRAKGQT